VIELCRRPTGGAVARLTRRRKAGRRVIRIGRLLERGEVTSGTGRRRSSEFPARVAGGAIGRRMLPGQDKLRLRVVVETGRTPP